MSRPTMFLVPFALAVGPLLFPATGRADLPAPAVPRTAGTPVPTAWTEPPEAVRAAAATLREACRTWTQQVPPGADLPPSRSGKLDEAVACDAALDPFGHTTEPMILGALFAAVAAGAALGTYGVVAALFRLLCTGLRQTAAAVRGVRDRRRPGWQE